MRLIPLIAAVLIAGPVWAGSLTLAPTTLTEWKAVYGQVEARETVPARARIGGVVQSLSVSEGDFVKKGQLIAVVHDEKIAFQVAALDARLESLHAQLATAETELDRGQVLVDRGVATIQRLDQLRTTVDVARGQIAGTEAERAISVQQKSEGRVLAPGDGRVLTVPATLGGVIVPGEAVATIGGGGFFLRLSVPERHASTLSEGSEIRISTAGTEASGTIAKIYPQIENGRVIADVDVAGLDTAFVNARVLVTLPVGERDALLVPQTSVETRFGLDFVVVQEGDGTVERAVVLGDPAMQDGTEFVEVLTGLKVGDVVVTQ